MKSHIKRAYNSQNRQAQAIQTRNRILISAKELFQAEGFEGVTIEKIAQKADVSGPTIYALFQSKRGILHALMDEAVPSDKYRTLLESVKEAQSPKELFASSAKIARLIYDTERKQLDIFRGASVLAPEFKELEKERENRRYKRQEESFKALVKEKDLAKGLTLTKAREILWAFTGRDLYRMLVVEQGWAPAHYEKWLAEVLVKTLLKDG